MQLCRPRAVTIESHILIIGAGLIGLCTADALAARGARVTVVDARPGPCEGTSFSNSGMIHPSQARSWVPGVKETAADLDAARVSVELAMRSRALLLEKIEHFGLPQRTSGCLQIQPDIETARQVQSVQRSIGVRTDIIIDPIESFGLPACRFPDDSSGDAQAFGCALADDLLARGVCFIYGAQDLLIRRAEDGFLLRTSDQLMAVDQVIVAAGVGSPDVLAQLSVRLRLNAVSGTAADFALPDDMSRLPSCPIMDAQSRSALTVFADRLRVSGGWGEIEPRAIIDRWTEIAPDLFSRLKPPLSTWTAKRPVSPAGRPYISATSVPGLWVNTGHGHMGWTLCAGSGELLAQMILNGRQDDRFTFAG